MMKYFNDEQKKYWIIQFYFLVYLAFRGAFISLGILIIFNAMQL